MNRQATCWGMALALALTWTSTAVGYEFNWDKASLAVDSTVSLGTAVRVEDRARDLLGPLKGGNNPAMDNFDEGNFNYPPGLVALAARALVDVEAKYEGFGLFLRGTGFFDPVNTWRAQLNPASRALAGRDLQLLDAYLRWSGQVLHRQLSVRLGYQVLNWGEGLFFQGGINSINAVDVRKLRVPGSELRDAFLPSPMALVSLEIVRNLNLEAFVTAASTYSRLDACGTFFAGSDVVCEGVANPVQVGLPFGISHSANEQTTRWFSKPEYGASLKYVIAPLHDTEVGVYFMNHHQKTPILSARSNTDPAALLTLPTVFYNFPTDIKMYGATVATNFAGISLSVEYVHRPQMPMQVSVPGILGQAIPESLAGAVPSGTVYDGALRLPVGQFSVNALKEFGRVPFADNLGLLVEVVGSKIWQMPPPGVFLDSPGNMKSFAWGYIARLTADYYSVANVLTITPQIVFTHDVQGFSTTGGNFVQGRTSLNAGVTVTYLDRLSGTLSYSGFYGGGSANIRRDKDFVGLVFAYQI